MRKFRQTVAVFATLIAVAGCSMHPLYQSGRGTGSVGQSLASITIPEPDSRLAQIIRNDLLSNMRPAGQAGSDRFVLTLKPVEKSNDIIDLPQPNPARQQVVVSVDYQLSEAGKVLTSGRTFSQVSYDIVRQPYSDMQAQVDAEKRAALELSSDIRTRLASYFSSRG
jgi:LPS-assembly lipoprotein